MLGATPPAVPAGTAVFIGIAFIVVRQIWTVRFGARGIIISDMVQGIVAYGVGTLIALGLLVWLVTNGHGFGEVDESFLALPGPDSATGGLYYFAIVLTGALGGWSWPDIFVRLFTSKGTAAIKRSSVQAAPIVLIFGTAVTLLAIAASTYPGVADAPDAVWFLAASIGGPVVLTLAGLCVLAGTMGNVGANLQALGTQAANDIVGVVRNERVTDARVGKIAVATLCILSAIFAVATANSSSGLISLALLSYEGIVQLAPTVFFGIFWRRGTATAATAAMISGFATAAICTALFPIAIAQLGGLTGGVLGLAVNTAVYLAVTFARPQPAAERVRVNHLFDQLRFSDEQTTAAAAPHDHDPAGELAGQPDGEPR